MKASSCKNEQLDWRWQLRNSVRSAEEVAAYFTLTPDEQHGLSELATRKSLPLSITPHYMGLMNANDPNDPLRIQMIPRTAEFYDEGTERRDPLGEEDHEVVPHLVHRYPDRVLLLVTDRCASYCRFCTRKRWVGQGPTPKFSHIQAALAYVALRPEIKEVIVSGGDALLMSDDHLHELLKQIRNIPHIEIIRLASRMLAFAPMRISEQLIAILKSHQAHYIMSHFNHVNEIDSKAATALNLLADNGIVVMNQTVLLRGVNDNAQTLVALFRKLVRLRARPYYLHQCDLAPGTAQFRVPLEQALDLQREIRGHVSGLCLPTFVIDIPGGFGKVSMTPDPVVRRDESYVWLKGFANEVAAYPLK